MSNGVVIKPIAHIKTDFPEKFGIPRQSGMVKKLYGKIIFEKEFSNPDAIRSIEQFSHLWLIWDFSLSHTDKFQPTVRPPRLGGNTRIGVFATRSPFRPNPLGLSCVSLEKIVDDEKFGKVLIVSGADMVDNTPIFDIKPYLPISDKIDNAVGGFSDESKNYSLKVRFENDTDKKIDEEIKEKLSKLLSLDPRPAYQNEPEKIYKMSYTDLNITFHVDGDFLIVTDIEKTIDEN